MLDTLLLTLSLHFTQPHFTPLHFTCWHFNSSHLNFTQLHFTQLHFTPLHLTCWHFNSSHLNFTQLHFTQLHFTTLSFGLTPFNLMVKSFHALEMFLFIPNELSRLMRWGLFCVLMVFGTLWILKGVNWKHIRQAVRDDCVSQNNETRACTVRAVVSCQDGTFGLSNSRPAFTRSTKCIGSISLSTCRDIV